MIEPKLYCLMRKDLQDLNPGKGMSQAMHAQAAFDEHVSKLNKSNKSRKYINEWKEKRSFGITIVLETTLEEMQDILFTASFCAVKNNTSNLSDYIVDETYPWSNFYGDLIISSETTCGYIFVSDETDPLIIEKLDKLQLHR